MSSSNSNQGQIQVPSSNTIIMETRKSLEDFRLPSQKNQWIEFKLEFLAEAGAQGLLKYFTPDQTDIDTIDAPEQRELNRAKAWNALVKATKSYGRFLLQSHIQTRDPAAAWTSIVKHYEPPPPKPSSFWSQMWTTIMLVLYTIYQLLPLFFVVLSEFLLICVMIVRVLADALRSVSDVLHSQWGPLLVLVLLIGGCVLLAMLEPIFMNQ